MKIYGPDMAAANVLTAKKTSTSDTAFRELLDLAGTKNSAADSASSLTRLAEPLPVNLHNISENSGSLVAQQVSEALNLLQTYAGNMGNPSKTLRELEPELKAIINNAESLEEEYQKDPEKDESLADIINDLLVTLRTEEFKMQRGDYNG